jgi:hypothetical protein
VPYLGRIPVVIGLLSVVAGVVMWRRHHRWAATTAAAVASLLFAVWVAWELSRPPEPGAAESLVDFLILFGIPVLLILLLVGVTIDLVRGRRS